MLIVLSINNKKHVTKYEWHLKKRSRSHQDFKNEALRIIQILLGTVTTFHFLVFWSDSAAIRLPSVLGCHTYKNLNKNHAEFEVLIVSWLILGVLLDDSWSSGKDQEIRDKFWTCRKFCPNLDLLLILLAKSWSVFTASQHILAGFSEILDSFLEILE